MKGCFSGTRSGTFYSTNPGCICTGQLHSTPQTEHARKTPAHKSPRLQECASQQTTAVHGDRSTASHGDGGTAQAPPHHFLYTEYQGALCFPSGKTRILAYRPHRQGLSGPGANQVPRVVTRDSPPPLARQLSLNRKSNACHFESHH